MPAWSEPKYPEDTPERRYVENVAVTALMVVHDLTYDQAVKRVRAERKREARAVWRDRLTREWWRK